MIQRVLPRLWSLFLAGTDLYAAVVVFYLLLRLVSGGRLWPVALFNQGQFRVHPHAAAEIMSLAKLATVNEPAILIGDFNLVDQNDTYSPLLDTGLSDAFRKAG